MVFEICISVKFSMILFFILDFLSYAHLSCYSLSSYNPTNEPFLSFMKSVIEKDQACHWFLSQLALTNTDISSKITLLTRGLS